MSGAFKPVRHLYADALSRLSWLDFEKQVARHFESQGYAVEHARHGDPAHRGFDLVLRRGDETVIAMCKHWTAFQVPHEDVHRVIGQMPHAGATSAMLITSGEFTRAAIDAAARFRHVRLVDGRALRALLGPVEEPHGFRLPPPESPIWAPVQALPPAPPEPSPGRGAAVASVVAAMVMALAMVTLFTWYIRDIHATRGGATAESAVYRNGGVAPAPPPLAVAPPAPVPGTGGTP
ncbi:restriction endonuclease [Luteibacter yeojuensis]|uniref:restriction endonuclease n=1 Tax=Luteibacter yeojuensis TaxID=345309 RepID=UPI000698A549|nr:restriction endonuclease [Luteibacter yeojuensis]